MSSSMAEFGYKLCNSQDSIVAVINKPGHEIYCLSFTHERVSSGCMVRFVFRTLANCIHGVEGTSYSSTFVMHI